MQPDHSVLKLPLEERYDNVISKFLDLFHMRQMLSEDTYTLASKLLHETFKTLTKVRPAGSMVTIECTFGGRNFKLVVSDDFKKHLPEEATKYLTALNPNVKVHKKSVVIGIPTR